MLFDSRERREQHRMRLIAGVMGVVAGVAWLVWPSVWFSDGNLGIIFGAAMLFLGLTSLCKWRLDRGEKIVTDMDFYMDVDGSPPGDAILPNTPIEPRCDPSLTKDDESSLPEKLNSMR